jgi:hypothetical protein
LLTGCSIALYTVVDKIAVSHYLIPPIVFDWACLALRVFMLWPIAAWREPDALGDSWRADRRWIVLVASCRRSPTSSSLRRWYSRR